VRSFHRAVTQRVGALQDRYLARGRPLGAARVLWEIGVGRCDVRHLRARLELDSGYLSRLLRSLEADGLVVVGPSEHDRRLRTARLTARGMRERAVLDQRSDELAASMLEPLTAGQRVRLIAAMHEVERLVTTALVDIDEVDPAHRDAQYCVGEYFAELATRFPGGFDAARTSRVDVDDVRPPNGLMLVAHLRATPVGAGALKLHDGAIAEIKRLWVAPAARGTGLGRRLLTELERRAATNGRTIVRLDTNAALTEAIALYRSAGYREVARFNDEPYADHWFEKQQPTIAACPTSPI
jgi:ribosomal protein S18 acetylase RimI-like enzyme